MISIFFCLLCIFPVMAVPPQTTVQEFTEGYYIEPSGQQYLQINKNYTVNFFVYNISNGLSIDDTDVECNFYMDNSEGNLVYSGAVTYTAYWSIFVDSGNFSELIEYDYGIFCNDSNFGGTTVGAWEVNNEGIDVSDSAAESISRGIYVLLMISVLFFIGFYILRDKAIPLKWTFFLLGIFFLTITINTVALSIHNYSLETDVFNVFDMFGAISYYMFWFVGGLLLIMWILTLIASMKDYFQQKRTDGVGE